MRAFASTLLLLACVSAADAAVLLRFINTVPTQTQTDSLDVTGGYTAATADAAYPLSGAYGSNLHPNINRVGLQYLASSTSDGALNVGQIVWTQAITGSAATYGAAPYAWMSAMPPLRAYHKGRQAGAAALIKEDPTTARVATWDTNQNEGMNVDQADYYNYEQLKADGVGLYLSFAAGQYSIQAYGVKGGATKADAVSNSASNFANSQDLFTFEDGQVYTLVATGKVNWENMNEDVAVQLSLIQESTAPTTFGKGAIRFFNALSHMSTQSIDLYQGNDFTTAAKIVSSLNYRSLSQYVELDPSESHELPPAQSGQTQSLAASRLTISTEIRAGVRATVICGITDTTSQKVFCRPIPSRVVAYVRLGNDNMGFEGLVLGKIGPQRLGDTSLSLWASTSYPHTFVAEGLSQVGNTALMHETVRPGTLNAVYPVVKDVAPGAISGYGEVFVPVTIMDYAVRPQITHNRNTYSTATNGGADRTDIQAAAPYFTGTNIPNYPFAPRFKRCNFLIKTDGFATLQNVDQSTVLPAGPAVSYGATKTLVNMHTLDLYMEPGEFYSVFVFPVSQADTEGNTAVSRQRGNNIGIRWIRDAKVSNVATPVKDGQARLILMPYNNQIWNGAAASLTLNDETANTGELKPDVVNDGIATTTSVAHWVQTPVTTWTNPNNPIDVTAGTYSMRFLGGSAKTTANACYYTIPAISLNLVSGNTYTLHVMNDWNCASATSTHTESRLTTLLERRRSAMEDMSTRRSGASHVEALPRASSAAAATSTPLALLAAAVLAALALVF